MQTSTDRARLTVFRLALLNPNTDERHTLAMRGVAQEALPAGCEVIAVNPPRGPESIESAADSVVAAAEVAALMRSLPAHDAYLIACFGDPGLDAARELTDAPVVGIGEAAYTAATLVSKRFGVITTLPRGIPALEEAIAARGLRLAVPASFRSTSRSRSRAAIIPTPPRRSSRPAGGWRSTTVPTR